MLAPLACSCIFKMSQVWTLLVELLANLARGNRLSACSTVESYYKKPIVMTTFETIPKPLGMWCIIVRWSATGVHFL